ncbi:MAG: translation elongation factor Ts [Planctomycetaceae bacterium]|jgi:elongation factor Ts|nr:translation elongation factor Ts [Planctomycetaceae bacterium]
MEISASQVKVFRDKTGLPMMDCKKALVEAGGDEEKALEILRKAGAKTMAGRTDRETESGRIALFTDPQRGVSAMVELLCESAPVSNTEEFILLVNGLAEQLATGSGAATPEELLAQPFPGKPGVTLKQFYDDLVNKIREVFRLTRIVRVEGSCGAYIHHNAAVGVLLPMEGTNLELGKDISMHVASMRPQALSEQDLDPVLVAKERSFVSEQVRAQNAKKPNELIEKIVDGKMKAFFAERTLLNQPFVKDTTKTVAQVCDEGKIKIKKIIHWTLGKVNN